MIHPEKGNHADHPGHDNAGCPLRHQVNASPYGTSRNGYACLHTGGHCVRSDACADRVRQEEEDAPRRAAFEAQMAEHREAKERFCHPHDWS